MPHCVQSLLFFNPLPQREFFMISHFIFNVFAIAACLWFFFAAVTIVFDWLQETFDFFKFEEVAPC